MMFILLSFCYYIEIPNDQFGKQLFVIIALLLFIFSHFMMTTEWGRKYSLILTSSDFILSSLFGLVFLGEGTLYLIFFGIVSVTLLLHTEDKRILYAFAACFMVVWITIMYLEDFINLWGHIISFSFVIFTTIVGSLINKLEKAQQQSHSQLEQLHFSHEALQQAHDQLREYSLKVEELTVYRERNRIARDIHDTVGHKMTALLVQLQLARELLNLDIEKSKTTIETCESLTRETLQEIRLSVRTIHVDDENYGSFVFIIQKLLRDFSKMTSMKTTFTVTGDPTHIPTTLQPAMIRLIQEAITNAKRHGTAAECNIRFNCSDDQISIQIEDNGIGVSKVTPGFGLINMKERAEEHGGFVTFQSEEEKGFCVAATFPLKQMKWSV
jgi:signal transduction histidine kinase